MVVLLLLFFLEASFRGKRRCSLAGPATGPANQSAEPGYRAAIEAVGLIHKADIGVGGSADSKILLGIEVRLID